MVNRVATFIAMLCATALWSGQTLNAQKSEVKKYRPGPWWRGQMVSGWKSVYDILVKDGYNVSIVQEPETSFKEDVAATKRVLAQQTDQAFWSPIAMEEP